MSFFENTKMDAHIVEPFDEDEELDYLGPVDEELEDEREILRWDEGGRSHCGYSDVVHESLMAVGQHLHSLFGEPSDFVHETMLDVGNYFQEISYAARDIYRGHTMIEKTSDIVDE